MKRVVLAVVIAAAAGLMSFNAPAQGATGYAGTMRGNSPGPYRYAKGNCNSTSSENGTFNIEVGDSVTWTNCSNTGHTVTGEGFGSTDVLGNGDTAGPYTFNTPGSYPYHCNIHSNMTGVVNVTGPAPTTTEATTPVTSPTTIKSTTTTATTVPPSTTSTTDQLDDVFADVTAPPSPPTSFDPTVTTRALGQGGDTGTSAGAVGLIVLGLGAVGTAAALLIRRMRAG